MQQPDRSTTVEIILYYLTIMQGSAAIYIYNSRNYSILLNLQATASTTKTSTTVEIILYYLTDFLSLSTTASTTVEIILYYLT